MCLFILIVLLSVYRSESCDGCLHLQRPYSTRAIYPCLSFVYLFACSSLLHSIEKEKAQRAALEQLEEEKILQYQREKNAREKEQEEKKQQLEAAKQRGYAAIYAKQDRELDKAAQLDALRARRRV